MHTADAAFAAIADPTRRRLIETLARGPATATGLAADLPITRQAVAKHLGLLRDADLVGSDRVGRETVYTLQPEGLRSVAEWSARVGREWERRLGKLDDLLSG